MGDGDGGWGWGRGFGTGMGHGDGGRGWSGGQGVANHALEIATSASPFPQQGAMRQCLPFAGTGRYGRSGTALVLARH